MQEEINANIDKPEAKENDDVLSSDSDDSEGESRNNLYWSLQYNLACLWYGNEEVEMNDMIEVMPFFDFSEEIIVKRSQIVKLEPYHCIKYQNEMRENFCCACLDFPEWDDHSRPSYVWSTSILNRMNNLNNFLDWCEYLTGTLGFTREFFGNSLKKMFVFSICADHLGLLQECSVERIQNKEVSDDVHALYYMVLHYTDSEDHHFRRTSSRVGEEFQSSLFLSSSSDPDDNTSPLPLPTPLPTSSTYSSQNTTEEKATSSDLINTAVHNLDPETISLYLCKVTSMRLIVPGSIVLCNTVIANTLKPVKGIVTRLQIHPTTPQKNSLSELYSNIDNLSVEEIVAISKEFSVIVYDGFHSRTFLGFDCYVFNSLTLEDNALEILLKTNYSFDVAFGCLLTQYEKAAQDPEYLWTREQFDAFNSAVSSCKKENIRKIYTYYKKSLKKSSKENSKSIKSFKSIFDLYEKLFPEISISKINNSNYLKHNLQPLSENKTMQQDDSPDAVNININNNPNNSTSYENLYDFEKKIELEQQPYRFTKSNRWPSSLSRVPHNLYWMKSHLSPCICLGLDHNSLRNHTMEPLVKIIPISSNTYHHEIKVSASHIEPLHMVTLEKNCQDLRAVDFAKALILFSQWEQSKNPSCIWYEYPSFVKQFLFHPPSWSSWRQKAERTNRGSKDDRYTIYFKALIEECKMIQYDDRSNGVDFPWDDDAIETASPESSSLSDSDTTSIGSDESIDIAVEGMNSSTHVKRKLDTEHKNHDKKRIKTAVDKLERAKILEEKAKAKEAKEKAEKQKEMLKRREIFDYLSPNSLYWLPRANLPALCIDYSRKLDEDQSNWVLTVKPICCSTYHYIVEVDRNSVEILSDFNLRNCHDERTVDFTYALIDFAQMNADKYSKKVSELATDMSTSSDVVFQWPGYFIDLMEAYRDWTAWRKIAEKGTVGKRELRKAVYLNKILSEFKPKKVDIVNHDPDDVIEILDDDDDDDDDDGEEEEQEEDFISENETSNRVLVSDNETIMSEENVYTDNYTVIA